MTRVAEIKPPRGAILSVEKLIQRTANGGVVYGVWCRTGEPSVERLTDARRTVDNKGCYVVRLPDGTLEERMGLTPCILVRSLDNDEDEPELRPMAYSALNLDGPVYRQCFAFSLREQAEAFADSQKASIAPPAIPDLAADQMAGLEKLRLIERLKKEIRVREKRCSIGPDTSYHGDKYASQEYFYAEYQNSYRKRIY